MSKGRKPFVPAMYGTGGDPIDDELCDQLNIDRMELLKDAAKAAGIELVWHKFSHVPSIFKGLSSDEVWNPLDDDGDAFRLAVQLDMMLDDIRRGHLAGCVVAVCKGHAAYESREPDKYAAMRRAIVRAAAALAA